MIHLAGPLVLVAVLAGLGVYAVLARRNLVLVLVGAELLLNAAALLLITVDAWYGDPLVAGQVLTLFVITIAAAEVGLALAVVLLLFRLRATSDARAVSTLGEAARNAAGNDPATAATEGVR